MPAVSLMVGILGTLSALLLPFAPVLADQTTVSWPAAGARPSSTTAFLVPYRPAELHATASCAAVQAARARSRRTTIVATTVVRDVGPADGLVVDAEGGRLRVLLNGRLIASGLPSTIGCDLRVDADDSATTVTVGGLSPVALPREPVPQVFAFSTDLDPAQALGVGVSARTRTWFHSVPAAGKNALLIGYVLFAAAALGLLAAFSRPGVGTTAVGTTAAIVGRMRWRGRWLSRLTDAGVLAVLAAWVVIGTSTDDDPYASMTIRNALVSGDVGNYYHWFNASEAPFTLVQRFAQPFAVVSIAPWWLRLPSFVVAVLSWFVITRGVLRAAVPALARRWWVPPVAALCFLTWWLPYNQGLRPEPFVTLGTATVLALLLRAVASSSRRPLFLLGCAALAAGATLVVTPSAILVLVPVLALLPRLRRVLCEGTGGPATSRWLALLGRLALLGALASIGLVIVFADQTLHGIRIATDIHSKIGPSLSWYQEIQRYGSLLGGGSQGSATKRVPVLLTIAALVIVPVLLARRAAPPARTERVRLLTWCAAGGFLMLWLTPSKWTHHFGALAGFAVPFLVAAIVLMVDAARLARDRAVLVAGITGGALLAVAAGLSFAGANAWYLYPNYGLSWRDKAVTPLGVPLDNPVLWAGLVAVVVAGSAVLVRRRHSGGPAAASLISLAAAPAVVVVLAMAASVSVLLASFAVAPVRQAASYSPGGQNIAALLGSSCGLEDKVTVMPDVPGGVLQPSGDPRGRLDGFSIDDGYVPEDPPPDEPGTGVARYLWGSLAGGDASTGTLASAWFGLPKLDRGQEVAVSVAGRPGGANSLFLQFGRAGSGTVVPLAGRRVDDDGGGPEWRSLGVGAAAVPLGADRVRVVARDASADLGGWLAVTGPRLRDTMSLGGYLSRRGPVLIDWPMTWAMPCVRHVPVVAHGVAQAPAVILRAPGVYGTRDAEIAYLPDQGGSFAGTRVVGTTREVASRLAGEPSTEWGHVLLVEYPFGLDAYASSTRTVRQWGWEGDAWK